MKKKRGWRANSIRVLGEKGLLDGISRHDFDAFYAHALIGPILGMRGGGGNLLQHVIALDQFAKSGVLMVEETGSAVADEKLAAGRVGTLRAGHRDDAARVRAVIELGLDIVAGIAHAPLGFFGRVLGVGVAALDHEVLDDPGENRCHRKSPVWRVS